MIEGSNNHNFGSQRPWYRRRWRYFTMALICASLAVKFSTNNGLSSLVAGVLLGVAIGLEIARALSAHEREGR